MNELEEIKKKLNKANSDFSFLTKIMIIITVFNLISLILGIVRLIRH